MKAASCSSNAWVRGECSKSIVCVEVRPQAGTRPVEGGEPAGGAQRAVRGPHAGADGAEVGGAATGQRHVRDRAAVRRDDGDSTVEKGRHTDAAVLLDGARVEEMVAAQARDPSPAVRRARNGRAR